MKGKEFLDQLEWLDPDLVEAADQAPRQRRRNWTRWAGLAACLCLLAVSAYTLTAGRRLPPEPDPGPAVTDPGPTPEPDRPQALTSETYGSLTELLEHLRRNDNHGQQEDLKGRGGVSGSARSATEGADTVSYRGTVYQRTEDGRIGIYRNGALTARLDAPAEQLFIAGERLVAVGTEYDGLELDAACRARVSIFDLADPASPRQVDRFSQVGDLTACWMTGTQLYLLTDDGVCACGYSRLSDLDDYKPQLFHGTEQLPWPETDISILGEPSRVRYVAAVRIDTEDLALVGRHAWYGDIETVFCGGDGLALVTQTTRESSFTIQDVYTFGAGLDFTGKVDLAAVFGLEKTLTWPAEAQPSQALHYPEVKAVDYAAGVWRMLGEYNHSAGAEWERELFALCYDPAGGSPAPVTLRLPEAQFDIDDVLWEAERAIITAGYVQWEPYATGARLVFAQFDGTQVRLLSSDILCDRVTGVDQMYEYSQPLGQLRPFISLGNGLYLRYNGVPDGFDLYELSDSNAPKCLYRSQGPLADLPAGGRLDFDNRVLGENTTAVKCICPGPDGSYFRDAREVWLLIQVQPDAQQPITLAEAPTRPVEGTDPAALG